MSGELFQRDYRVDDLVSVLNIFDGLNDESKKRLLQIVATHIGVTSEPAVRQSSLTRPAPASFSEDRSFSPKEFVLQKQPKTEVERVACLAYYLTHYRDQPHFTSVDISKLNTEAAQAKLMNPSRTVDHAVKNGYLVAAPVRGQKQISAAAEKFVEALPDHEAAKAELKNFRARQRRRRSVSSKGNGANTGE